MASRQMMYDSKELHPETVTIHGSFAPNNTGTVDNTANEGAIGTVTRTGQGTFSVVLRDSWPGLISAIGTVQLATAADMAVQFGSWTPSTKTLVVRTMVAGTATDIAANANNRVNLALTFRNTVRKVKN